MSISKNVNFRHSKFASLHSTTNQPKSTPECKQYKKNTIWAVVRYCIYLRYLLTAQPKVITIIIIIIFLIRLCLLIISNKLSKHAIYQYYNYYHYYHILWSHKTLANSMMTFCLSNLTIFRSREIFKMLHVTCIMLKFADCWGCTQWKVPSVSVHGTSHFSHCSSSSIIHSTHIILRFIGITSRTIVLLLKSTKNSTVHPISQIHHLIFHCLYRLYRLHYLWCTHLFIRFCFSSVHFSIICIYTFCCAEIPRRHPINEYGLTFISHACIYKYKHTYAYAYVYIQLNHHHRIFTAFVAGSKSLLLSSWLFINKN